MALFEILLDSFSACINQEYIDSENYRKHKQTNNANEILWYTWSGKYNCSTDNNFEHSTDWA